jgi:phage head maturation protease
VAELEYRAAQLATVSFPKRLIEVIVTPWEQEAMVEYKGRVIREIFQRGAYDGLERRANRVRVNRDHNRERIVGRATAFHPSREEGLVAEIRIARTELGDETLTLADDDCLDASAEFAVMGPDGETWTGRDARRITRAWLGGIGLTPDPAFVGAKVLAVRAAPEESERVETPNLDRWKLEQLRAEYARLDALHLPVRR